MKKIIITIYLLSSLYIYSENIKIIAPYGGVTTDLYKNDSGTINEKDTSPMFGLFFQYIDTDLFQANTFLYGSNEIHNAVFWGAHFNADYFLPLTDSSKLLLGGGFEFINPSLETSTGGFDVETTNNIYVPFLRAGYKKSIKINNGITTTIMPWAGVQYEIVEGEVNITGLFGPPPETTMSSEISEKEFSGLAGINIGLNIFHFIDISLKYKGLIYESDYLQVMDVLSNFYFNRSIGLSYRYKYSQKQSGYMNYHLLGLIYSF